MCALVDDRDLGKLLAVHKDAALVNDGQDIGLRNAPRSGNGGTAGAATRPDAVVVVAAYSFVQAYELLGRNDAFLERLQTVLHADVVVRKLGFRLAVRVDERAPLWLLRAAIGVAAHTVRAESRVINDRRRESCPAIIRVGRKELR